MPIFADVQASRNSGRLPVDEYTEGHVRARCLRSHDQVDVAGMEAERDPATWAVESAGTPFDRPLASISRRMTLGATTASPPVTAPPIPLETGFQGCLWFCALPVARWAAG